MGQVSKQQFEAVVVPQPVGRWHPVGPVGLMQRVDLGLEARDIGVLSQRFDLTDKDGQQFHACYEIDGFTAADIPGSLGFTVSFQGSVNKTIADSIMFGSRVLACFNGLVASEYVLKAKNTTNVIERLDALVKNGLDMFEAFRATQTAQYHRLAETKLTDAQVHDFICRALRTDQQAVTGNDIVNVLNEWHEPQHQEFEARTAWSLHNAFTEVGKLIASKNPVTAAGRNLRLNRLFVDEWAKDLATVSDMPTANGRTVADDQASWMPAA